MQELRRNNRGNSQNRRRRLRHSSILTIAINDNEIKLLAYFENYKTGRLRDENLQPTRFDKSESIDSCSVYISISIYLRFAVIPISVCLRQSFPRCWLFGFFSEISATCAALFRACDFNRSKRAVFAVIVVFAIANVAFDAVIFVVHKKPPLKDFA